MLDVMNSVSRRRWLIPSLAFAALVCGGCTPSEGDGAEADGCNARMQFEGITYRAHNKLDLTPTTRRKVLGEADVVNCDDDTDKRVIDRVAVHRIRGVQPSVAIAVKDKDWLGVYAAADTGPDDWPAGLLDE